MKNANPLVACSKDYEAKMNRSVQYWQQIQCRDMYAISIFCMYILSEYTYTLSSFSSTKIPQFESSTTHIHSVLIPNSDWQQRGNL